MPLCRGCHLRYDGNTRGSSHWKGKKRGPFTEEHKEKLRNKKLGNKIWQNMPVIECKHCGVKMKQSHITRYHNDNCKFKK